MVKTKKAKIVEAPEAEVLDTPPKNVEKPKETKAVVRAQASVIAGIELDSKNLKKALDAQTEQRKLIKEFIQEHLVPGVDYLRIHVVRSCFKEKAQRGSCSDMKHFSKDILAKPGQEKIFSLFQLSSELQRDTETMEMLPGRNNLVAYKCLVLRGDKVVAEGRGAAEVGDKGRDVNSTIKIAEMRARMDACLALGFSEYFAQDLDDPDYQNQKKAAEEQAAAQAVDGTGLASKPENSPVDDEERSMLARYMLKLGFNGREEQLELLAANGIDKPKEMTSGQCRGLIIKLKDNVFSAPTKTVLDDVEDVSAALDEAIEQTEKEQKIAQLEADPPMVVDEEFKVEMNRMLDMLGLNYNGQMWLLKKITGKPFGSREKFTENEWRRAYDVAMAILNKELDVPDRYVAGLIQDDKPTTSDEATYEPVA